MIGIAGIGVYVPDEWVDNKKRAEDFGTNSTFIEQKVGFLRLARKPSNYDTSDLCVEAYADLLKKKKVSPNLVECLVVCTQTPDGDGLPHTSAIVHQKLNLHENIAAFDISLGCSGYVYSLAIIQSFMHAHGMKNGLLFTADPYSKILDDTDKNTALLFGDAATCTLISESPCYVSLLSKFSSDGSGATSISVDPARSTLTMNGQDVFMFAMKKVPCQIEDCLAENKLSKDDIDLYVVHQGSKFIVDNLRTRLGVSEARLPFAASTTGNTVSSSIPLVLSEALSHKHNYMVLSGFGVGLSWATTVLKRYREV